MFSQKDQDRFRKRLEHERATLIEKTRGRAEHALAEQLKLPDEVDQASSGQNQALELRLADKDRKLLKLIEHALTKFAGGEYGYCEGTGEPIALPRLEARPWARYSVAYKEQLELERALHVED
ncbi:MAG: TraR/DksA C4-type zinc finger protein [Myxococcota bacterium]